MELLLGRGNAEAGRALALSAVSPSAAVNSADSALRRIVADCRKQIATHCTAVQASDDPSGIHEIRVALRRLRAAVGLFRGVADEPHEVQFIDAEARRLARAFSPARDLQVFLNETAPDAPSDILHIGGKLVGRRVARARAVLGDTRFAEFDQRLARFAEARPRTGGETFIAFARRALDRCEAKVRRRGRGLARLKPADLHRLRIAAKKLRYAVGFLAPAFQSGAAEGYANATIGLQNALGLMNDRVVSAHVLADIARAGRSLKGLKRSCDRLTGRLARPSHRQRKELKRAWKAFKKSKPFWR
jgi:triphosphatase